MLCAVQVVRSVTAIFAVCMFATLVNIAIRKEKASIVTHGVVVR